MVECEVANFTARVRFPSSAQREAGLDIGPGLITQDERGSNPHYRYQFSTQIDRDELTVRIAWAQAVQADPRGLLTTFGSFGPIAQLD